MAKQFGIPVYYKNKIDFIKKIIDIHLTIYPSEDNFFEKAKEALAYYILYGYNKETVSDIETMLTEKIKKGYVRSINSFLRKNGFLIKDDKNKQKSFLSPQMQQYRDHYVLNGNNTLMIGFIHKK